MQCPECSSEDVRIDFVQTAGRSSRRGTGLGGNLNNAARASTALMTMGMSNLVWKKSKGSSKTKFKTERMALCQNCGASWKLK